MILLAKNIQQSEDFHYRTIVNRMSSVCGFLDMQGRVIMVTPGVRKVMGYEIKNVLGRSMKNFIHPEDYANFKAEIKKVLNGSKKSAFLEYRAKYANGEYYWQQITWELIKNHDHESEVFFNAVDINDLKLNEIFIKCLFDVLPDGISIYRDGQIRYTNKAFDELFSYGPAEELVGRNILSFVAKRDKQRVNDYAKRRNAGDKTVPTDYEAYFQRRDGEDFLGQIKVRKIKIGFQESWVLVVSDITKQRLVEADKRLESIGALAGGIAHDFNNILTVVLGYLELLRISRDFEPGDIIQIEEQIRRASSIANQLMTFSKGGLPVKENCSLSKLLEDLFKFLASGSNVKIKRKIAPTLWTLFADKAQISAVLENLLKNAKEAMSLGGVVVVEAENEVLMEENNLNLPAGPYVRIAVLDNGPGIPDHVLKNIFQPWNTTKSAGKGNGLGLYMAYGIIKKHRGQMLVDSVPGQGTKFTLYLPAVPGSVAVQNEEIALRKEITWDGEKLLILEDEESIINLLKRFFAKQNLRAVFARNSAEAVNAYQEALSASEPFAAVVLDLTIPGGPGGKETIALLRELDPQVNALVTSGHSEDPVMSNFADHGFKDRIKKPYNLTELNDTLSKVIIKK